MRTAGMVGGGFGVGRVARLEQLISACLLASGAFWVVVGWGVLPDLGAVALAVLGVVSAAGVGARAAARR